MDLKGQFKCEKNFLWVMWVTTILAAVLTFVMDDVTAMFYTFVGGLGISSIICIPEWKMYNRNPLTFVKE